jgi:hypothetical protein
LSLSLSLLFSGIDGRNSPLLQWITLSEHCLLVGKDIVWYHDMIGWWPAQQFLRSSLYFMKTKTVFDKKEKYLEYFNGSVSSDCRLVKADDEKNICLFTSKQPWLRKSNLAKVDFF